MKITPDGTVKTVVQAIALNECDSALPPGTPEGQKPFLTGLAVDARGTVYAAAAGCRSVIVVKPDGKVDVIPKAEKPWSPTGVALHGEDLYVREYANVDSAVHAEWRPRVRRLGRDGKVATLATITEETRERPPR